MKKLIIFLAAILFISCNPCKYVAKHSECFPADSASHESEHNTSDSSYYAPGDSFQIVAKIIADSNCINAMIVLMEQFSTAQTTINNLKIEKENDKIILTGQINKLIQQKKEKEVVKEYVYIVNPVNVANEKQIEELNDKLSKKDVRLKVKNRIILILSCFIGLVIIIWWLNRKLKFIT